ncbi:hypothetical protein SpCBS45565_g03249 [Spizellomyces sp. 'palustris']|nr:hypothetical protein SpCBS45565_g03249 [Spizellomyces sp. 'palustris']
MPRTTRSSAAAAAAPTPSATPQIFVGSTLTLTTLASKDPLAKEVQKVLKDGGGKVVTTVSQKLTHLVAVPEDFTVAKVPAKVRDARDRSDVAIVSLQFVLDSAAEGKLVDPAAYSVVTVDQSNGNVNGKSDDKNDADDIDATLPDVANGGKKSKKRKKAEVDEDDDEAAEPVQEVKIVKAIKKGRAAVDHLCPVAKKCHVYENGTDVYDALLNQTEIKANNNKFYIIQVLEEDAGRNYYLWTRWGRVGQNGMNKLESLSKEQAIRGFERKFYDKSRNNWGDRANFSKIPGKYFLLERDFGGDDEEEVNEKVEEGTKEERIIPDSKLPPEVQDLIKLIFNVDMMTQSMVEIGYDAKKMPLGKLSKGNIEKGYAVLAKISDELTKAGPDRDKLSDYSSQFYTIIPHEFGMSRPPIIDSPQLLKRKLEMVEALGDIEIATSILSATNKVLDQNPVDLHYSTLRTDLVPVDEKSDDYQLVKKYLENTHAATHRNYELEIEDLFEVVSRHGEDDRFKNLPNRQLLWHGSRLTNFVGILSQGLRIAPPEAPVTGYMFGKGVYFADMVSKSANYCCTSRRAPTGILLLCEVALGEQLRLKKADYDAGARCKQANCQSTHGLGETMPDPAGAVKLPKDQDVTVPCGQSTTSGVSDAALLYNEFIVYDVAQVRIR